jgi:hypothetical protein
LMLNTEQVRADRCANMATEYALSASRIDEFWSNVDKSAGPDGCWIWTGPQFKSGYGWFHASGNSRGVHRIAWFLANGPIPILDGSHGGCVCHTCDVKTCVNPRHLFIGTHTDNMQDKIRKGRANAPVGERNSGARLSEAAITEIRRLADSGERHYSIASRFGISRSQVSHVAKRQSWAHVDGNPPPPIEELRRRRRTKPRRPVLAGEAHPTSILTQAQVEEIRSRPRSWGYQTRMAAEFGVAQSTVSAIILGRRWRGAVQAV